MTGVTHVVHLAALQYPFCRDDHVDGGARSTCSARSRVFDAALGRGCQARLCELDRRAGRGAVYGVWKRANEGTTDAFWAKDRFPSIGLRPALGVRRRSRPRGNGLDDLCDGRSCARRTVPHRPRRQLGAQSRRRRGAPVRPCHACRRLRARRGIRRGRSRTPRAPRSWQRSRRPRPRARISLRGHFVRETRRTSTAARSSRRSGRSSGGPSSGACSETVERFRELERA